LAWELASAGELLIHPGKPICNGLITAMSAACEVFAFTPRPRHVRIGADRPTWIGSIGRAPPASHLRFLLG